MLYVQFLGKGNPAVMGGMGWEEGLYGLHTPHQPWSSVLARASPIRLLSEFKGKAKAH